MMYCRIVGEQHEHLFSKYDISSYGHRRHNQGVDPCPVYHLHSPFLLLGGNILADHGQCGELDALRDLIDDIVDAHADTEGGGGNNTNIIDKRADIEHGNIDTAGLNGHGSTLGQNHFGVMLADPQAFWTETKTKGFFMAVKIEEGE